MPFPQNISRKCSQKLWAKLFPEQEPQRGLRERREIRDSGGLPIQGETRHHQQVRCLPPPGLYDFSLSKSFLIKIAFSLQKYFEKCFLENPANSFRRGHRAEKDSEEAEQKAREDQICCLGLSVNIFWSIIFFLKCSDPNWVWILLLGWSKQMHVNQFPREMRSGLLNFIDLEAITEIHLSTCLESWMGKECLIGRNNAS